MHTEKSPISVSDKEKQKPAILPVVSAGTGVPAQPDRPFLKNFQDIWLNRSDRFLQPAR
jgi:hypothetical protein